MKGYHVYSKIQQLRLLEFSQRQAARRLGINRKTVKRYWELPVNEYEETSTTICRMQYLDKYQKQILNWLKEQYRETVSEQAVSRYVKQLREEYGLSIRMCRGADPESKRKIENVVKYIKGNFLSHRMYVDDGILNGSCLEWLERS